MRFRAYLFDVQGTLLDFFSPVRAAVSRYLQENGITDVDAADFTRAWRENYFVRLGRIPQSVDNWRRVQDEYVAGFGDLCAHYRLPDPDPASANAVARAWTGLQPWPDVRDGIARLRRGAIVASLSNTDMSTAISLFKGLAIDMDAIFTAELFGAFKPDPTAYQRALRFLGLRAAEVAMVASHPYDLEAAGSLGLGTIFISRPLEYGDPALAHQMAAESVSQYVHSVAEIR